MGKYSLDFCFDTSTDREYYMGKTDNGINSNRKFFSGDRISLNTQNKIFLLRDAAGKLHADHPRWSGMGKLISDTRRMIDGLCEDARVDSARVGIAGHSLGGKMAFYTGCLDERVKVILASDFGFGWEQSNWDEPWYWNGRVKELEALGLDHTVLLELAAPKPFCLLAGEYDDASSGERMGRTLGYASDPAHLKLVHH